MLIISAFFGEVLKIYHAREEDDKHLDENEEGEQINRKLEEKRVNCS